MAIALYPPIAKVAEEGPTRCAGHFVAAFTALNGHATSWALLAILLQWQHKTLLSKPYHCSFVLETLQSRVPAGAVKYAS